MRIFEHERLSREPKGKGRAPLQILISRDFEPASLEIVEWLTASCDVNQGPHHAPVTLALRLVAKPAEPTRALAEPAGAGNSPSLHRGPLRSASKDLFQRPFIACRQRAPVFRCLNDSARPAVACRKMKEEPIICRPLFHHNQRGIAEGQVFIPEQNEIVKRNRRVPPNPCSPLALRQRPEVQS